MVLYHDIHYLNCHQEKNMENIDMEMILIIIITKI